MSARSCSESRSRRGWSGSSRDAERDELEAQRIALGVAPVDQRQQVGRHAHRHRRALEAALRVRDEVLRDQTFQRGQQLADVGDRVLRLPLVVEELGLADVRVGRDAPPELAAQQLAVREAGSRHRRPQRRRGGVGRRNNGQLAIRCHGGLIQRTTLRQQQRQLGARPDRRQQPASAVWRRREARSIRHLVGEAEHRHVVAGAQRRAADQVSPRRDDVDGAGGTRRRRPTAGSRGLPRSGGAPLRVVAQLDPPQRGRGVVTGKRGAGAAQVQRAVTRAHRAEGRERQRQRRQHPQAPARDAGRRCRRPPQRGQPARFADAGQRRPGRRTSRARRAQARAATRACATARPAPAASTRSESLRERPRATDAKSTAAARSDRRRAESPASRARRAAGGRRPPSGAPA